MSNAFETRLCQEIHTVTAWFILAKRLILISQYTGEHMTNNEFRNAQDEIMLTNSHYNGLVYLNEKIDLNKSQCINDDTTDLHRDGLVNTKEKIVVDKFNYINGHTGNKESLNVEENSHHNVIQQPYNNNYMINTKV